jgi:uncharacterized membrane protein
MKTYQIRYNTNSTDDSTSWRLICDGKENIVSNIEINAKTITTKDFVSDIDTFKYHISCTGNLIIKDNVAYISNNDEKKVLKTQIIKTISYRLISSLSMVCVAYSMGINFKLSTLIGVSELVYKPVLYFIHERVWHKFNFIKK